MPQTRIQTFRHGTGGIGIPPGTPNGVLHFNGNDRQLEVVGTDGVVIKFIAIRDHSQGAAYTAGQVVLRSGDIYRARGPIPGQTPFNADQWFALTAPPVVAKNVPPTPVLRDGSLWFDTGVNPPALRVLHSGTYIPAAGDRLSLSGGTVTGPISYAPAPTVDAHLANKKYIDDRLQAFVPISAGQTFGSLRLTATGTLVAPQLTFGTAATGVVLLDGEADPRLVVGGLSRASYPPANLAGILSRSLLTKGLADGLYYPFGAELYEFPAIRLPANSEHGLEFGEHGTGITQPAGDPRIFVRVNDATSGAFPDMTSGETPRSGDFMRRDLSDARYLRTAQSVYSLPTVKLEHGGSSAEPSLTFGNSNSGLNCLSDTSVPQFVIDGNVTGTWPRSTVANMDPNSVVTKEQGEELFQPRGAGVYIATGRINSSGDVLDEKGENVSCSIVATGRFRVSGDFSGFTSVLASFTGAEQLGRSIAVSNHSSSSFDVYMCNAGNTPQNYAFAFVVF